MPNSIWNLTWGVWLGLAAATDQYLDDMKRQAQAMQRGGR